MLLRFTQWAPLPVGHLLYFTDTLVENLKSDLRKPCLLLNQEHLAIEALGVDEILHVLDEFHMWELSGELVNI